jgi:hypothetical protein
MKKNQERRLHRKNAKIVKEGGTPMQLNRPLKPDTTRKCGHCGQMGHMSQFWTIHRKRIFFLIIFFFIETNRKCPKWAEFNPPVAGVAPGSSSAASGSGTTTTATTTTTAVVATTAATPGQTNQGFIRGSQPSFGFPAVPSPLVTSPPVMAMQDSEMIVPASSGPKIKLSLNKFKKPWRGTWCIQ